MVVSVAEGIFEVSRVRWIGEGERSSGREVEDGEGDRTIEGIRPCLPVLEEPPPWGSRDICTSPSLSFGAGDGDGDSAGEAVAGAVTVEASQFHSKPGFTIRFTVSPLFTGYSLRSFPSARALPRRSRRCASAGGAPGCAASCALMEDMTSVGETEMVNVRAGLDTLKSRLMVSICRRRDLN